MSTNSIAVSEAANASHGKTGPALTRVEIVLRQKAATETLAMSMVHDLRSPLAAIHSAAIMLSGCDRPNQQVRRLAVNIRTASARIQELLQDYVDVCRGAESQRRPCILRSLVSRAVHRLTGMNSAHSLGIELDIPADLVVTVDRGRIDSVLANLLGNALDAMPAGGTIHISAIAAEHSVVVRVRDTGPGVAPEIRDRLFEPFVSARKRNGWGLGLAHSRQAVIDHGGDMWLETSPGGGACFAFSLPAQPAGCSLPDGELDGGGGRRPTGTL